MSEMLLFNEAIAWFSTSVSKEHKKTWEDNGGQLTENLSEANYIFSDDPSSLDTKRIFETGLDDENVLVFKSLWIEHALEISTNSKLVKYGIEQFILLPQNVLEEINLYGDEEKYREHLKDQRMNAEAEWNKFEMELSKRLSANAELQSESQSKVKVSTHTQQLSTMQIDTPSRRTYNLRRSSISEQSSPTNSISSINKKPGSAVNRKRSIGRKENNKAIDFVSDKPPKIEIKCKSVKKKKQSTKIKSSYSLRSSSDETNNNSQLSSDAESLTSPKLPKKKIVNLTKKSEKGFVRNTDENSNISVEVESIRKGSLKKTKAAHQTTQGSEKASNILGKNRYSTRNKQSINYEEVTFVDGDDTVVEKVKPETPVSTKKKRKLFKSSSTSLFETPVEEYLSPVCSKRKSSAEEQISPRDIHGMLNKNDSNQILLSGGNSRNFTKVTSPVFDPITASQSTEKELQSPKEIKQSREEAMKKHLNVLQLKRLGEKGVQDFTYGSFSGFTHIDDVDIPNLQLEDFIVNKKGCRVKLVNSEC